MLPKPMIEFFLTMPVDVRLVEPFIHIYLFIHIIVTFFLDSMIDAGQKFNSPIRQ